MLDSFVQSISRSSRVEPVNSTTHCYSVTVTPVKHYETQRVVCVGGGTHCIHASQVTQATQRTGEHTLHPTGHLHELTSSCSPPLTCPPSSPLPLPPLARSPRPPLQLPNQSRRSQHRLGRQRRRARRSSEVGPLGGISLNSSLPSPCSRRDGTRGAIVDRQVLSHLARECSSDKRVAPGN